MFCLKFPEQNHKTKPFCSGINWAFCSARVHANVLLVRFSPSVKLVDDSAPKLRKSFSKRRFGFGSVGEIPPEIAWIARHGRVALIRPHFRGSLRVGAISEGRCVRARLFTFASGTECFGFFRGLGRSGGWTIAITMPRPVSRLWRRWVVILIDLMFCGFFFFFLQPRRGGFPFRTTYT